MLTPKQEAFAQAIARGENQSDAYRQAYDATTMAPPTLWSEASRMCRHPEVAARVEELRAEEEASARSSRDELRAFVMNELIALAATAPSPTARIRALELVGKSVGLFTAPEPEAPRERSAEEIRTTLKEKMGFLISVTAS